MQVTGGGKGNQTDHNKRDAVRNSKFNQELNLENNSHTPKKRNQHQNITITPQKADLNKKGETQQQNTGGSPYSKKLSPGKQNKMMIVDKEIKLEAHERKIGNYIMGKSIGEGTFGKVKLGRHIQTNEKVSFNKSKI